MKYFMLYWILFFALVTAAVVLAISATAITVNRHDTLSFSCDKAQRIMVTLSKQTEDEKAWVCTEHGWKLIVGHDRRDSLGPVLPPIPPPDRVEVGPPLLEAK